MIFRLQPYRVERAFGLMINIVSNVKWNFKIVLNVEHANSLAELEAYVLAHIAPACSSLGFGLGRLAWFSISLENSEKSSSLLNRPLAGLLFHFLFSSIYSFKNAFND